MHDISTMRLERQGFEKTPEVLANEAYHESAIKYPRLRPAPVTGKGSCAVVGYGPSLKKDYALLDQFETIFSCSGAHDFLLRNMILPTYHVEVDPAPTKAKFTKNSRSDIGYIISTRCHPSVTANMSGRSVRYFDSDEPDQMCDVGQQAVYIAARYFGYKDIYLIGFDGSYEDETHAGPHHMKEEPIRITCKGKEFQTNSKMLIAVLYFPEVIKRLAPEVKLHVAGEGLLPTYIGEGNG